MRECPFPVSDKPPYRGMSAGPELPFLVHCPSFRDWRPAPVARALFSARGARNDDDDLKRILKDTRCVAVVGVSSNPLRASYFVARYLIVAGLSG
jgi:hypothetical protein